MSMWMRQCCKNIHICNESIAIRGTGMVTLTSDISGKDYERAEESVPQKSSSPSPLKSRSFMGETDRDCNVSHKDIRFQSHKTQARQS